GSATPDRGQQVLPAHHTFAVINQKQEKIEYLRFDLPQAPSSTQLPAMPIKGIVFENKQQLTRPQAVQPCRFQPYGTPGVEKNQICLKEKSMPPQSNFGRALAPCISRDPARSGKRWRRPMSGQATVSTKHHQQGTTGKGAAFVFGLAAYLVFFATFLYAIGFVEGLVVPKTIDSGGVVVPLGEAAIINLLLMALFAIQHSVMARRQFKQWWTRYAPRPIE